MDVIRQAYPESGSYPNEGSYFEPNFQHSHWGANYPRLLEIKKKVDPDGLFYCRLCVGSEEWSADGFCRSPPPPPPSPPPPPASPGREVLLMTLYTNHTVVRTELDGSNPVQVVGGRPPSCGVKAATVECPVAWPDGQQVDVARRKVYWSNMGSNINNPNGLGCDNAERTGSVWRADWPSGENVEAVVPEGTIGCAKQLHYDAQRQQMYVGDKGHLTAGSWRIDLAPDNPPFKIEPLAQGLQRSASGVGLDSTGEKVIIASDGEGHTPGLSCGSPQHPRLCEGPGLGVMNRVMPPGMTAQNRTDVQWFYTADQVDHVFGGPDGKVFWTDYPDLIRVGSIDGRTPAKTIQHMQELHGSKPIGISLAADGETLYYSDCGFVYDGGDQPPSACGMSVPASKCPPGRIFKQKINGGQPELVYTAVGNSIDGVSVVRMPK